MSRKTQHTYDPKTGKWTTSEVETEDKSKGTGNQNDTSEENTKNTNTSGDTASGDAEKKYNEIEINILKGSLSYIPTKETIKIKARDTITLKGLGKYLSGKYYVESVERKIDSSGYTHSASVLKLNFGDTLKPESKKSTNKSRKDKKKENSASSKTHTVKKGETIYTIAKKYYGDRSNYKKVLQANKWITKSQYNNLPIGKKISIP